MYKMEGKQAMMGAPITTNLKMMSKLHVFD